MPKKEHVQRLVADIRKDKPELDWDQRLAVIKESIRDDIRSNKGE
jgi:hypothetical protein